jgi:hypothetical protein
MLLTGTCAGLRHPAHSTARPVPPTLPHGASSPNSAASPRPSSSARLLSQSQRFDCQSSIPFQAPSTMIFLNPARLLPCPASALSTSTIYQAARLARTTHTCTAVQITYSPLLRWLIAPQNLRAHCCYHVLAMLSRPETSTVAL